MTVAAFNLSILILKLIYVKTAKWAAEIRFGDYTELLIRFEVVFIFGVFGKSAHGAD